MQTAILNATASIVSAYVSSPKQAHVTDVAALAGLVGLSLTLSETPKRVEPVVVDGRKVPWSAERRKKLSDSVKATAARKRAEALNSALVVVSPTAFNDIYTGSILSGGPAQVITPEPSEKTVVLAG